MAFVLLQLSFDVGILVIFGGRLSEQRRIELKNNYFIVDKGYNSFPTNLPGTLYSNAIKVCAGDSPARPSSFSLTIILVSMILL